MVAALEVPTVSAIGGAHFSRCMLPGSLHLVEFLYQVFPRFQCSWNSTQNAVLLMAGFPVASVVKRTQAMIEEFNAGY